ncbi:MAG: prolyl oligopeptidase family serine peptidase [Planctomycetota bacterium]|nr:prolyl oligopeptidase family serine peptidase [Planctomycetota bacterium]
MTSCNRLPLLLAATSYLWCLSPYAAAQDSDKPSMRVISTPTGVKFGLFGKKPSTPAPTLFVFAAAIADMNRQRIYSQAGEHLARDGWLYVTLDPPCHGDSLRPGEPAHLVGWAHRVKQGQDLIGPFVKRCRQVLDFLIAEGYSDPARFAACGTSRGGFCAFHLAAAEPRIQVVTAISPVTNLLALREFKGVEPRLIQDLNVTNLAQQLGTRPLWLSIGDKDQRVSTADCRNAARQLQGAALRRQAGNQRTPVDLVIAPVDGHRAIPHAYKLAAQFIQQQMMRKKQPRNQSP